MNREISPLQAARLDYKPKLPTCLKMGANVELSEGLKTQSIADQDKIKALFPNTYGLPIIQFKNQLSAVSKLINIGLVLSGGQAPGGHNVVAGIFDGIKSISKDNKLYGFLGGPGGLVDNKYIEITADFLQNYRNTGGFDIIGSGRTKLEKPEQFDIAAKNCQALGINAIVIVGGDDSNTNACLLAEYYLAKHIPIQVVGCPKTIDGDLKNEQIETSFGFDTACRVYSELIGNLMRDTSSAKKYWHFVKLMGRSASHITLECALQTHPNITLIGEEVLSRNLKLMDIVNDIAGVIAKRAANKMDYGVVLIPEGLIEFIPEIKSLIAELNDIMANYSSAIDGIENLSEKFDYITQKLTPNSAKVYLTLPHGIRQQLIMDRDPHGNVQVSRIDTEKLLIEMLEIRLKAWKAEGKYKGKFSALNHFFGYEGRCAAPSNFDADYCYGLGFTASALVGSGKSGYMSSVRNLTKNSETWTAGGIPITMMMNVERRHGEDKPVIQKALVRLDKAPFIELMKNREKWAIENHYLYPGPIQYFGPSEVCDLVTHTLKLEQQGK
ncbi:MAG TPA: diphosphate--fructose-6-phosphate 1-phosphotransferase [Lentisphaeria bacterium]|nr:MAG: diphosphate--fructose-6-phosphate 1-phosphotransferase [Lentisphaerae bacterium GWF2_38_69]HBM16017.1 diphosphate--fructose-6-phosphate 1-phosphotransferase [Lentisphaeria bacterium]